MNNNEIAIKEESSKLTAAQVLENVNLIQSVMNFVMKNDMHYGIIPGCGNKPTLLKAGAEKLMMTFKISVEDIILDKSYIDESTSLKVYSYQVKSIARHMGTGKVLGISFGEASTNEEKYKWREAVCNEEYNETLESRRRLKWFRGGRKSFQVIMNAEDKSNTVLKIASKRALVAVILKVTAASDIFTQDLEDNNNTDVSNGNNKGNVKTPVASKNVENNKTFKCSSCDIDVPQKVHEFSMNRFKKSLCFDCQKTQ